jgi:DNA-binding MarR family transcriptional regulator
VVLTEAGTSVVEEVMPAFNREEAQVTGGLTVEETATLARLLRTVLRTAEDLGPR